jgi:hypothetical protein
MKPDLRARADVLVVDGVGGLARARHGDHLPGVAPLRHVVADQAEQVALAFVDVHRNDFFREAVVLAGLAEVQLADRGDAVAGLPEQVVPGRRLAVVGVGVVPVADLVDVLAAGEARARRDADRAGGVGRAEARAARGERVQVRRVDHRMARATQHLRVVLVRHDHQQIARLHRLILSPGPMKNPPFHFVPLPKSRSTRKPRLSGRTMIVDDGLPLAYARDLVALGGAYIDLAKIKTAPRASTRARS